MKKLLIGLLTFGMFSSFAQTLPEYSEENLITDKHQKSLILEALKLDLKFKEISACEAGKTGAKWRLVDYFLDDNYAGNLYVFEEEQPVIVLRSKAIDANNVNYIDFQINTNADLSSISTITFTEYTTISERINVGTLVKPVYQDKVAVRELGTSKCF